MLSLLHTSDPFCCCWEMKLTSLDILASIERLLSSRSSELSRLANQLFSLSNFFFKQWHPGRFLVYILHLLFVFIVHLSWLARNRLVHLAKDTAGKKNLPNLVYTCYLQAKRAYHLNVLHLHANEDLLCYQAWSSLQIIPCITGLHL